MTDTKLRIAIAESLGALVKRQAMKGYKRGTMGEKWVWRDGTPCAHPGGGFFGWGWNQKASVSELPDYPRDLNAMHAAESRLNDPLQFRVHLQKICRRDFYQRQTHWSPERDHATAAQRAEAFYRAIASARAAGVAFLLSDPSDEEKRPNDKSSDLRP